MTMVLPKDVQAGLDAARKADLKKWPDTCRVHSSKPVSKIKEVIEHLGGRMQSEPDYFTNVLYKIEPGALRGKGLQYLTPAQLQQGRCNGGSGVKIRSVNLK